MRRDLNAQTSKSLVTGLENGFEKKPRFFGFLKKPRKTPKVQNLGFLGFFLFFGQILYKSY